MKTSKIQDIGLLLSSKLISLLLPTESNQPPEQNRRLTFKDWVSLQQLVLDVLVDPAVPGDGGDVLHHQLPRLRLPGAALTGEDDGLVLAIVSEEVPGTVCQGVTERGNVRLRPGAGAETEHSHVGRQLVETVAPVLVYYIWSVEGQLLVRVDAHHQAGHGRLELQIFLTVRLRQTLRTD